MKLFKKTSANCLYLGSKDKKLEFNSEVSILDVALKNRIDLDHSCGGSGSCGTCRIFIIDGLEKLEPRGEVEAAMAEDRAFVKNERLACQIAPVDKVTIEIPKSKKQ